MTPSRFKVLQDPDNPHVTRVQHAIAEVLNPVAQSVLSTPLGGGPKPSWTPVDAQTGWSSGSGTIVVGAVHVDALGYVHGQGAYTNTTGGVSVAIIGNLPKGMRPKGTIVLPVSGGAGTTQQYLIVTAKGDFAPGNNVAAGDFIGFSFPPFLAEQ